VKYWDPFSGTLDTTPFSENLVSFSLNGTANNAAQVTLELANDTGAGAVPPTPGFTTDPTIIGCVSNDGSLENVVVEIDYDGDPGADATVETDSQGRFVFCAPDLTPGAVTIQARAVEVNYVDGANLEGDWSAPLDFTLEASAGAAPVFESLGLLNDTGDPADQATVDPTITGQVTNDGSAAGLLVEFDYDGDDELMATATTLTDGDGRFTYMPYLVGVGKRVAVHARVLEWNAADETYLASPWQSVVFTLADGGSAPAQVESLTLAEDVGGGGGPACSNPTVVGTVANDGSSAGITVEIDTTGDFIPDGMAVTDAGGAFTYTATDLPVGTGVTIHARAKEWNPATAEYQFSAQWADFTFTVVSNSTPTIQGLQLVNDTGTPGDGSTTDPTIQGTVVNPDGGSALIPVKIDIQGDDTVDAVVFSDENGEFTYTPTGLAAGAVTIRARALEWDGNQGDYLEGATSTLEFTQEVETPQAPLYGEGIDESTDDFESVDESAVASTWGAMAAAGADYGMDGDDGVIDVGVGSYQTSSSGAARAVDGGSLAEYGSAPFAFSDATPGSSDSSVTAQPFEGTVPGFPEGAVSGTYDADYEITVDDVAKTITTHIYYHVAFDSHTAFTYVNDTGGEVSSHSVDIEITGSYTYEYDAVLTYDDSGPSVVFTGTHTISEDLSYSFSSSDTSTYTLARPGEVGVGTASSTATGSYSYHYGETASLDSAGTSSHAFSMTESSTINTTTSDSMSYSKSIGGSSVCVSMSNVSSTFLSQNVTTTGSYTTGSGYHLSATQVLSATGMSNSTHSGSASYSDVYASGSSSGTLS